MIIGIWVRYLIARTARYCWQKVDQKSTRNKEGRKEVFGMGFVEADKLA